MFVIIVVVQLLYYIYRCGRRGEEEQDLFLVLYISCRICFGYIYGLAETYSIYKFN